MSVRWLSLRHLLALLLLVGTGALLLAVVRNLPQDAPTETVEALPQGVDLALQQFRYVETRGEFRRWSLDAEKALYEAAPDETKVEGVEMVVFLPDGSEDNRMTARHGTLFRREQRVELEGDVTVTNRDGYTFYTEKVAYRDDLRQVQGDAPVRVVSESLEMTGTGLTYQVDSHRLQILNDVKATFAAHAPNS